MNAALDEVMGDNLPTVGGDVPGVLADALGVHVPGIEIGGDASAYYVRRKDVASKSGLDVLAEQSPAHYAAWCEGIERPETAALAFGKAFHMAILEPDRFPKVYVVEPAWGDLRFKENKLARAAWQLEHAQFVPLPHDDYHAILGMRESIMRHPLARNLMEGGQSEIALRWIDPATGLKCKARSDYWVPELELAFDLKKTISAHPSTFARSVAKYRYHVQDAFYTRGFAATGNPIRKFLFVAVEDTAPYACAVHACDDGAADRGEQLATRDLDTLARCVERNEWPAYGDGINSLALPAYAFYD